MSSPLEPGAAAPADYSYEHVRSEDVDTVAVGEEEEEEQHAVQHVTARKRAPVEEGAGKSSVMPETMAMAARAAATAQQAAMDLGEVAASAAVHEVHSRVGRVAAAAPQGSAAQLAYTQAHRAAVAQSGDVGRAAGQVAGSGIAATIMALARRVGAHQCDECGLANMYDYMICQDAACQGDNVKLHRQQGYDLCYSCYAKLRAGKKFHPQTHVFTEHRNAVYTLRLLGVVVVGLVVVKYFLGKIF